MLNLQEIDQRLPLSHNGFSVDLQAEDALYYIASEYPEVYNDIKQGFPEIENIKWDGSWIDTESMGVDPDWPCWLIDAIENTGLVWWEESEPWAAV